MAHSDALIFLTNITWIFFLFLFTYFFFVLFVLPTFYKKFRTRVLIKNINFLGGILSVRNVLVSLVFCVDTFKALNSITVSSLKASLVFFKAMSFYNEAGLLSLPMSLNTLGLNSLEVLKSYNVSLVFADLPSNGSVVFTRYLKS